MKSDEVKTKMVSDIDAAIAALIEAREAVLSGEKPIMASLLNAADALTSARRSVVALNSLRASEAKAERLEMHNSMDVVAANAVLIKPTIKGEKYGSVDI
jgi:hypothetical protein